MKTIEQVKAALVNSEFFLEYLPTIRLTDRRCVGAEALLRWHTESTIVPPLEFVTHIENPEISESFASWIIEEVARELGDWLRTNHNVHIAINIPPSAIGRGAIKAAALRSGLMEVADKLIIEITERGFPDQVAIDAMGLRGKTKLAIDDYGTGDANLQQLSTMDADIIKIDKYFVDQITDTDNLPKIIRGIIAFSREMEMEIIAEGIEHNFQAELLEKAGVLMGQGWYFSKSLPSIEFIDFHDKHQK